jgi:F-type H+-transporting ATPase subunit a
MNISLFHNTVWKPFASYGLNHVFFEYNANTLLYTWIGLATLIILSLLGRWALQYPLSISGYVSRSVITSFYSMVEQSLGRFVEAYFFFIASLFIIIFICNALVLIPGLEEPTQDLNTTIAFACIAFFYAQKETLLCHGLKGYILEYVKMPFVLFPSKKITPLTLLSALLRAVANMVAGLLSLPLEVLGKLATIVSLSLRLFGNIFGSAVITTLLKTAASGSTMMHLASLIGSYTISLAFITMPLILILVMLASLITTFFFGLFEAFIQAFVFSVLSLTYLALGTQKTTNVS